MASYSHEMRIRDVEAALLRNQMDTENENLIGVLRSRMEKMTDYERLELMHSLMEGYCEECGCEDQQGRCQCWNDERRPTH